jgi:hypothetical protein
MLYQVACGLNVLHENKIIHCDMKPQNILVYKEGMYKIADFGIHRKAKEITSTISNETKAASIVGTLFVIVIFFSEFIIVIDNFLGIIWLRNYFILISLIIYNYFIFV